MPVTAPESSPPRDRAGELTALGARQHQAIARRMYDNYPALLSQPLQVSANSSDSRRVMLSMAYFVNELKSLNPSLSVSMDASQHDLYYIKSNKAIVVPPCPTDGMLYDKLEQFVNKQSYMGKGKNIFQEHQSDAVGTHSSQCRSRCRGNGCSCCCLCS